MSESLRIINLKCRSCGGALEIYPDIDHFACGYCGSEQLVERRGGTVALKPVIDAVARVQTGTDKTAAELAIVRLERELAAARLRWNEADSVFRRANATGSNFGVFLMFFSPLACLGLLGTINDAESFVGAVAISIAAASCVLVFVWGYGLHKKAQKSYSERHSGLWRKHADDISRLETLLETKRKLVDS